ncbi:hypothetical protein H4S04_008394 [Coemansia sp. S16]|nr:hypothetical protein H4S04_008394 [Coemansia sp. S16]
MAEQLMCLIGMGVCGGAVGQYQAVALRRDMASHARLGGGKQQYVVTRLCTKQVDRPSITIVEMWRQIVRQAQCAAGISDSKSSGWDIATMLAAAPFMELVPEQEALPKEPPLSHAIDADWDTVFATWDTEPALQSMSFHSSTPKGSCVATQTELDDMDALLDQCPELFHSLPQLSAISPAVYTDSQLFSWSHWEESYRDDNRYNQIANSLNNDSATPTTANYPRRAVYNATPPDTLMRRLEATPESIAREISAAKEVTRIIEQFTVRDVLSHRGYPTLRHPINDTATVQEALTQMRKHNAVSLPVLSSSNKDRPLVDVISVYDLRDYIIHSPGLDNEVQLQLLSGRASGARTVLSDTVAQVVASRKHATQEISATAPLESLIRLFSTLGHHLVLVTGVQSKDAVHRVPRSSSDEPRRRREWSIGSGCSSSTLGYADSFDWEYSDDDEDSTSQMWGLTQYDVLHFIQHHNHQLGHPILDMPATSIASTKPLTATAVISQSPDSRHTPLLPALTIRDSALSAMKQLRDSHTSALPVVDIDGRLIAEIAGTGMRYLTEDKIGFLGKPVLAFIYGLQLPKANPYVIHEHFTMSQIMTGLLRMNSYRAWLVDSEERPICAISTTDILSFLL